MRILSRDGRERRELEVSQPVPWADLGGQALRFCAVSCDNGLGLRWWGLHEVRDSGKRREGGLRISSDGGLCRASAEEVGEVPDSGGCMDGGTLH